MPFSSESGKAAIKRLMQRIKPQTGLDIGCGSGTYPKLFPETMWHGVEAWEPYFKKYDLGSLYSELWLSDVREWEPTRNYDVAIAGDVLEHMDKEDAIELLKRLQSRATYVIISIPIGHYPQGEYEGNPYERHVKDDWSDAEVREAFGEPLFGQVDNEIGVYLYGDAKELSSTSGVYCITHKDSGKQYVGKSANMYGRWGQHRRDSVSNRYKTEFYNALRAHGLDAFLWQVLEFCDKDQLDSREVHWISALNTFGGDGYNHTLGGDGLTAGSRHSEHANAEKSKRQKGKSHSPEHNAAVSKALSGQKRPEHVMKKLLDGAVRYRKGRPLDEKHKRKLSSSQKGRRNLPEAYTKGWETRRANINRKKLKIVISAISKNEAMFVERFCNSARDADGIYIADTGSADKTIAIAKASGAIVSEICITPWRFDDARNAAIALLPRDADVVVSLDLDEELQPGWREEIERVWVDGTTRLRYGFDWGAGLVFKYEKIFSRHGYRFLHPCHEYPTPYLINEQYADTDMLLVIHKPDNTKSRGQYLPLLEMSVKEDPIDPRNAFYYARELSFHGHWHRAIEECNRYLALPGANWPNERCYAYRVISRCYDALGDWEAAVKAARQGVIEAPYTREPWCEITKLTYQRHQWAECYGAAMSALAIEQREWVYTVDPAVWGAMPHDYASIAAYHLGMFPESLKHVKLAIELDPADERFKSNLTLIEEALGQVG